MGEILLMVAVALGLVGLWWLGRRGFMALLRLAADPPGPVRRFGGWARRHPLRARARLYFPRLYGLLAARLEPRRFSGLPLTLMLLAAAYAAALFGGLVGELRETSGVIRFDAVASSLFADLRDGPAFRAMLWLTDLGGTATLTAVTLVASGLLWAGSRWPVLLPLWVTIAGSQATTWIGKFAIERQRREFLTEASAISPSFPSAHATGAMAVYGFLAYVVARQAGSPAQRWDIGYWTAVLILLIGISRVHLSVHYASDVAAGFLVGAFWLLVGFSLAEWRRAGMKPRDGE